MAHGGISCATTASTERSAVAHAASAAATSATAMAVTRESWRHRKGHRQRCRTQHFVFHHIASPHVSGGNDT
jgi:hypothetical protein